MNIKYLNTDIRKKIVRLAKNAGILLLIYLSIWLLEKNHLLRCSILDDLNFLTMVFGDQYLVEGISSDLFRTAHYGWQQKFVRKIYIYMAI